MSKEAKPQGPQLSLVVPVLDEADNIHPVLDEVVEAWGDTLSYEVIFVDDGSTDPTAERVREAARDRPFVRLVRHRKRRGKSAAMITGIEAARTEWIATMDGDGQNDPADVLALYRAAREDARPGVPILLAGARRRRQDTWLKRVSSRVANRVRTRILGDDTPDAGCGLKVFRRNDFLALPRFENMHRFLPALFIRLGGTTRSLPVNDRPRAAGRSKYGFHNRLWVGLSDLFGVWWLMRRALPTNGASEVTPDA